MEGKIFKCMRCGYFLEEEKWPVILNERHCPSCGSVEIEEKKKITSRWFVKKVYPYGYKVYQVENPRDFSSVNFFKKSEDAIVEAKKRNEKLGIKE